MVTTYLGPGQEGGVGDVELVPLFLEGRAARRRLVLAHLAQISVVPNEGESVHLKIQNSRQIKIISK